VSERTIHVFDRRAERLGELIHARAPEREVVLVSDPGEFTSAIRYARVLFAPQPPREGWSGARRLELVQVAGVGVDHFLPAADLPAPVEVAGMRGAFAEEAAEHAMMMLLALTRELPAFLRDQRSGRWRQRALPRLSGRRLGIVGLGAIGSAVARRAKAFGLEVRAIRREARPSEDVDAVYDRQGLHGVAAWCDALVVAAPLTPETGELLDAAVIGGLREGAVLVNIARAGLIAPGPLLARLQKGTLRAALDAFEDEPLPASSPLWMLPNVVVTPHVAGYGEGYLERAVELLLDNVGRLERGEPRAGLVDRALGY